MRKPNKLSLSRAIILRTISDKEPIAIHEIQKETDLPRSTIVYYLGQLKIAGLIEEKSSEDIKKEKELGSPVYLTTNKTNPALKLELAAAKKVRDFFNKIK